MTDDGRGDDVLQTGSAQGRSAGADEADFEQSLRELSELATGQLPLRSMLTKVAEFAVLAIPGAEGAGLTLIADDRSEVLVSTNQLVTAVDAIQYGIRQGPCVTAATEGRTVVSRSLGDDKRWPEFGPRVVGLGVHSALSLPLLAPDRVLGAMNIYARTKGAFDDNAARLGQMFAVPAAAAVQNAQILAQAQTLATQLQRALAQRAAIDQAVGVLIGTERISADEAERRLIAMSRDRRQKIHEVAEATVRDTVDRRTRSPSSPPQDRSRP